MAAILVAIDAWVAPKAKEATLSELREIPFGFVRTAALLNSVGAWRKDKMMLSMVT